MLLDDPLGQGEPQAQFNLGVLYEDIEQDEEFWTIIAMLMLVGATFALRDDPVRAGAEQARRVGELAALPATAPTASMSSGTTGATVGGTIGAADSTALALTIDLTTTGGASTAVTDIASAVSKPTARFNLAR